MKFFQFSKKFWVVVGVMGVSLISFYFYLFGYVPKHEREMVEEKFRRLSRLGLNILEAKTDSEKNLDLIGYTKVRRTIRLTLDQPANAKEMITDFDDSISASLSANIKFLSLSEFQKQRELHPESVFLKKNFTERNLPRDESNFFSSHKHEDYITLSTPIEYFLSSRRIDLKRDFDEAIIIKIHPAPPNSSVKVINRCCKPDTVEHKKEKAQIAYQTFPNIVELKKLDSLLTSRSGLLFSSNKMIRINSIRYLIFPHRFHFDDNEDWLVCGLVQESKFVSATRQVDLFNVILVVLLIVFTLLAMPILKLLVMSAFERLQIVNVWFVGFSIIVGVAITMVILLLLNHVVSGKDGVDNNLHRLATSIESCFEEELREVYKQSISLRDNMDNFLDIKNSKPSDTSRYQGKLMQSNSDKKKFWKNIGFKNNLVPLQYPLFSDAIWMDAHGEQLLVLSTYPVNKYEIPIKLDERDYFRRAFADSTVDGDNLWPLPGRKPSKEGRFAMESIRSWRNGETEIGFTIPLKATRIKSLHEKPKVFALITRLSSVMDAVLPPGFGFCIADEKGDVWFHSDSRRNRRENLFEETSSDELRSAVLGRDSVGLDIHYSDEDMRAYVLPVSNIPLSLVVFKDLRYYYTPINMTVGYAFWLVVIMFGIIGIQLILLFVCTFRPTRLRIKRFFLSWLRPRIDVDIVSINRIQLVPFSKKYAQSFVFQIILLALMICFSFQASQRWMVMCFMLAPVYLLLFHFWLLNKESLILDILAANKTIQAGRREKRIKLLLTKRNIPFAMLNFWDRAGVILISNGILFTFSSFLLIVMLNTLGAPYVENWYCVLRMQIVWVIVAVVCLWFPNEKIKLSIEWIKFAYPTNYRVVIVFWLTMVSILAPIYMYKTAYVQSNNIWSQYIQLEAARKVFAQRKELEAKKYYSSKLISIDSALFGRGYFLTSTNEIGSLVMDSIQPHNPPISQDFDLEEVLFKASPELGDLLEGTRQSIFKKTADQKWYWDPIDKNGNIRFHYLDDESRAYILSNSAAVYRPLSGKYGWLFPFALIIAILCFYRIIRFAVKNVFGLEVVDDKSLLPPMTDDTLKGDVDRNIFLVGLPFSGKSAEVKKVMTSASWIDLRDKYPQAGESTTVVIDHFEYGVNNHDDNKIKLKLLQAVLKKSPSKLIILSTVQPSVICDFYNKMAAEARTNPDQKQDYAEYRQAIRYWKNILKGFSVCYQPLESGSLKEILELKKGAITQGWLVMNSELKHGRYLPRIEHVVTRPKVFTYRAKEEVALQVEELAENYYQSLWNCFTNPEKFLLYDLANDRFVNFRNSKVIRTLLAKGVLTGEGSLRIMNRSFSNFILSTMEEDEEMRVQDKLHANGTWNTVQLALILIMVMLVSFVAFARQGMLSGLNAWVTAITGVIALLSRFSGIFGTNVKN